MALLQAAEGAQGSDYNPYFTSLALHNLPPTS